MLTLAAGLRSDADEIGRHAKEGRHAQHHPDARTTRPGAGVNIRPDRALAASKLYQGLCEYSFDLQPMPKLAKSWSLSEDKKTYTFRLQENVKFQQTAIR